MKPLHVILALSVAVGCASNKGKDEADTGSQKSVIAVSNYPLKYFTERLTTGIMEVRFPAAVSNDPAYWKPSPEDVSDLQKADLIVLNGATYEQWVKNVSLPASRIVETAEGFKDRWIPLAGAVTHSHGLEGEHEHAGIAFTTWLDMTLALEQVRAIRDALVSRWPDHSSLFEDNLKKLEADLLALDLEFRSTVGEKSSPVVVFSHPVYQYFERRYGITGVSVHWEPDVFPAEDEWNDLAVTAKKTKAAVMIWEGQPDDGIARRLAAMDLRVAVIDPCSNTPANGDFLTVMRQNAEILRSLLPHSERIPTRAR